VKSPEMVIAGITITAVGGAAIAGGLVLYGVSSEESRRTIGWMVAAAGGACLAVGIPLWVVGSRPENKRKAFEPRLQVGAGSLELRWQF